MKTGREIGEYILPLRTLPLYRDIYTVHRMIAGEREDEFVLHGKTEELSFEPDFKEDTGAGELEKEAGCVLSWESGNLRLSGYGFCA